jgi:hypothetical protein
MTPRLGAHDVTSDSTSGTPAKSSSVKGAAIEARLMHGMLSSI